jgi:hypothetical protein
VSVLSPERGLVHHDGVVAGRKLNAPLRIGNRPSVRSDADGSC